MEFLAWIIHAGALITLSIFGVRKFLLVRTFLKDKDKAILPTSNPGLWPEVALQLPVYNERYVIKRLVRSVTMIDYPKEKLHIQILDDSTDSTRKLIRRMTEVLKKKGFRVTHLQRGKRQGFKAGALENGLAHSTAPFIAVFDADFVIPPDFLKRTIPFLLQPDIGWVQTRWGHLNRNTSLLTRLQAMILDANFSIEHISRHSSEKFSIFNGSGGIWNRQAIIESGGWHHDTLTEDLDISHRAQLKGWRSVYLYDVVVPGELPTEMSAYKNQQHRWTKGSIQVAFKLAPRIWKAELSLKTRVKIILQLFNDFAYALMVLPAVLVFPVLPVYINTLDIPGELETSYYIAFLLAMAGVVSYYGIILKVLAGKLWPDCMYIPLLVGLGLGLSITNIRATLEVLIGYKSDFIRTPKYNSDKKSTTGVPKMDDLMHRIYQPAAEVLIVFYFIFYFYFSIMNGQYYAGPLFLLIIFGFCYSGLWPLFKSRRTI